MIAEVVLFLLTSGRAQNAWAEKELEKDTYLRKSNSIPYVPPSIRNNVFSDNVAGEIERLNWLGRPSEKYDICLTPGCQQAANEVLKNMDKHTDPCDNFYEFACGNFLKETKIPDDQPFVELFSKAEDNIAQQLKVIVEKLSSANEARYVRMVEGFYTTCMNKTNIEELGLSYMKEILQKMGGWPVLEGDRWNDSKFTWEDTVYKFKDEGFSIDYLIKFTIETDMKNSNKRVIQLDQASLSLKRGYLVKGMDEKFVQALYSYMVDIAVMFGADHDRAAKELKESLDFEINLANISMSEEERRDNNKLYNPMTITQLQERFPSIPWAEYITTILSERVKIEPDQVINVNDLPYIKELEKLLRSVDKRIQANYIFGRAVADSVSFLTEELRKRQLEYTSVETGQTTREPRWKECVKFTDKRLPLAVSSLYVQHIFKQEVKKNATDMVDNIRDEMYRTLESVDWMDNATRNNALEKSKAMASYIAYPDELLDVSKLDDYYRKLEISHGNFLKAVLSITKFDSNFSFGRLKKPVNKTEWISHGYVTRVNAFYSPPENSFELLAGIMQGAFFSSDRPSYMNYGAIGWVTGHEITHGFDDEGSQFDKDGNLHNWWASEAKKTYLRKAACIINQYGNYTVEQVNMNINGVNTQGENIADNGGIKLAYRAYNRWAEKHGTEQRLPGLQDFTPQQMFWISAANMWCSKYRLEALKDQLITDEHSPSEFRVRGSLSNRDEFAKDFKCPPGSKMNPYKKCRVW